MFMELQISISYLMKSVMLIYAEKLKIVYF